MAECLLLKHYRGAPTPVNDGPMDRWTPQEVSDHIRFMNDFASRLEETGEYVDEQALAPEGLWAHYDGEGRPFHEWLEVRPFLEAAPPPNE